MNPSSTTPSALRKGIAYGLQGAGAFLAVLAALLLGQWSEVALLMAPFGASCVIAFAIPDSPLAQPRSIVGGHLLSTAIGLVVLHTAGFHAWSAALALGLSIVAMQWTRTLHPPAGADPLLVMMAGSAWSFLWSPVLLGSLLIVAVAWGYHRVCRRTYPQRWL
ncbi:HPP family protein [Paenibacillus oleatilyticus]|uniref:HPP family protein n=1 Tax=Paenibacillus oleatilyticus TaxID=2594886 RepID=UPI001C1F9077|nr:HPP family protein [Paenibacillus oleatilyticus]MBU7316382.1 HPP family protein [Paenibacillus oleatilyticus]